MSTRACDHEWERAYGQLEKCKCGKVRFKEMREVKIIKKADREQQSIAVGGNRATISGDDAPNGPVNTLRNKKLEAIERQLHYLIGQVQALKSF